MAAKFLTVFVFVFLLAGCAFQKPPPYADYGQRVTPDQYEQIPYYMASRLKDPDSAKYRYLHAPIKAYVNDGLIRGGEVVFVGWLVPFEVNAKNSYGGYTGWEPYTAYYQYGGAVTNVRPGTLSQQVNVTVVE